jgi:hypothetical protein
MDTTAAESEYVIQGRIRKALRLIDRCRSARDGAGFTVAEVEAFTDEQWGLLAEAASTPDWRLRNPSARTRTLVLEALRRDEARAASEADEDDPFVGL